MSILRLKTVQALASCDGDIWDRVDLSFKARALYVFLSRFDGFLPLVGQVEEMTGLGRDARRAGYRELERAGLLQTRVGTYSHCPDRGRGHGA